MGYPVWDTPAGDLGKIAELEYYNYSLVAHDPDEGYEVEFQLIAGRLPPGIQINNTGYMIGLPAEDLLYGTPTAVSKDRDYKFTVRAVSAAIANLVSGGAAGTYTITVDQVNNISIGAPASGTGIPSGTTVVSIVGTTITLSEKLTKQASGVYLFNTDKITDRTFSITVTGNKPPDLLTGKGNVPPVSLGSYLDATVINLQLEAIDPDAGDTLTWSVIDGELPLGLTLNKTTGVISGVARPYVNLPEGATAGWDNARWQEYPWEFSTRGVTKNYVFTIQVTDGKNVDTRRYSILVYSHNNLTSDDTNLTMDNTDITVDSDVKRPPLLLTEDLGVYSTYVSDNYFSFKFEGLDLDDDELYFEMLTGVGIGYDASDYDSSFYDRGVLNTPPGFFMNTATGWLTAYIPPQVESSKEYTFVVQCYKKNYPSYVTPGRLFTITILGNQSLDINWLTSSTVGTIQAGEVSQKIIEAEAKNGDSLSYTMKNGSRLPPGLTMLSDGSISGRCSFQSFTLDSNTTTFDINASARGLASDITTFDKTYKFTVIASNESGTIQAEKIFYLKVFINTVGPYENLYLRCLPPLNQRDLFTSIVNDTSIFPSSSLYRPNDPFWGRAKNINMLAAYGIQASLASDYIEAMQDRHYTKKLYFGEYGTNIAKDSEDNIIYEVVWVEMIEETRAYVKGVKQGPPTSSVNISSKIANWRNPNYAENDPAGYTLKPNDQLLMRRDLANGLGDANPAALPLWMTSVQKDLTVPGFVTRVPLVYCKPGEGDKLLYRLKKSEAKGEIPSLNNIAFVADRYISDSNLSQYWDVTTSMFQDHNYTTFDAEVRYSPEYDPIATVDFAVEIPYTHINGRTVAYVESLGGLDGIVIPYDGMTLIFAKQDNYGSYSGPWWTELDGSTLVPGYADAGGVNKRAGIWQINVVSDIIYLEFLQEIEIGSVVNARYGSKYGGNKMKYDLASVGDVIVDPYYTIINPPPLSNGIATTFDSNSTRFVNAIDIYQLPDEGDKYLKFPKIGVFS